MFKRVRSLLVAAALVLSIFALVPPAAAHGNCTATGDVFRGGLFNLVTANAAAGCDVQHQAVVADFYLQEKFASQSSFHNLASEHKGCISCKSVGVVDLGVGYDCVHNAWYRVRIVWQVSNHNAIVSNRDTSILC